MIRMKDSTIVDVWRRSVGGTHVRSSQCGPVRVLQVSELTSHVRNNRPWSSLKPCSRSISQVLCLLIWCTGVADCQGVFFTSGPLNQTIAEGGTAKFDCVYEGSFLTPSWRINTTIYSHSELPSEFELNDDDFSLTLHNVALSLNFTAFQCVVGTAFSSRAWLIVERNETSSTECVTDCVTPTSNLHSSPNYVSNTTQPGKNTTLLPLPDVTFGNISSKKVILAATVPAAIILLIIIIVLGVSLVLYKMAAQKKECRISTGDNEAYSAIKKYQRSIKTQTNPSYELTNTKLVSIDRCQSPQA